MGVALPATLTADNDSLVKTIDSDFSTSSNETRRDGQSQG